MKQKFIDWLRINEGAVSFQGTTATLILRSTKPQGYEPIAEIMTYRVDTDFAAKDGTFRHAQGDVRLQAAHNDFDNALVYSSTVRISEIDATKSSKRPPVNK